MNNYANKSIIDLIGEGQACKLENQLNVSC